MPALRQRTSWGLFTMRDKKRPVMLIILDGFGEGKPYEGNAVTLANTPVLDGLFAKYPHTTIRASEHWVGLPDGQMGNSEVGHLNIGAGRVMFQDLTRITQEIQNGEFYHNEEFLKAVQKCKENGSALHLMGLVSEGGVHSHMLHLLGLLKMAKQEGLTEVYVHAITDGRDVAPDSATKDIANLEMQMEKIGVGKIATVVGRYYAMDRDRRWERVELAYNAFVLGEGEHAKTAEEAVELSYQKEVMDEFILPTVIGENRYIQDKDSVIFFNFRPDRARQIVRALVDPAFEGFPRKATRDIYLVTMTQYDKTIPYTHVAYEEVIPKNTLGEVLANHNLKQLRIAETEKYAHVTFFFNGGREEPFPGEDRILIPSPKVATYDLKPQMSAEEVCDAVLQQLEEENYDCIILNFANTDMVGHTGSIPAAIMAVETVDTQLGRIVKVLEKVGGAAIITADHGNCEVMLTDEGKPVTSHTTNVVPLILVGEGDVKLREDGALCDLSPTLLQMLQIEQPEEMTGKSLIEEE